MASSPTIACLCGSTSFYKEFVEANREETMAGKVVLSVGVFAHSGAEAHGEEIQLSDQEKKELDALHKRKIDSAQEILVINVGGHVGDSTRSGIR